MCKPLIVILTMAILLSGCAGMDKTEESKSKQYSLQGCIAGGAVAGILTYVMQSDDDNALTKSLIASALGCMAGAVIGFEIGERTEKYANAQQAAEAETLRNKETAARLQQYNTSLEVNISDYETEIAKIRNSTLTAQEKQESLKETKQIVVEQKAKAADALSNTENELNEAKNQYADYKDSLNTPTNDKWEDQLANLEQEKLILSRHVNTLNALDASI